jgi:hypothetical protein
MSKILNLFNDTIEDYNKFVNDRATIYIERINSSIKQIEEFIDSNKEAIIDGILITTMLRDFYEIYSDDINDKTERIDLNSEYDIYSFETDKFIIGTDITSIKVVCYYNTNTGSLSTSYYMNVMYDDPIRINTNFDILSTDVLGDYSRRFENFTTNFFDKLKRINFVSIEKDLSVKLENFKRLIEKLKD